ncbi:DUF4397 domain-containing protein [Ectobacillus antri]|uniref:DUF4397 domain-containing protein n=1 Tax=Ectobacillus antri TaxID=2486280 RepID=A0ABT6H7T6_9BACI|nr:DUF4397 domain-containing protein [Ectobacillus antri]MDG4657723.1 DUF4397 domain-containing protein [Ectobacillus antri]MDG5754730.1 DUF4397 domain-containing protein [Ectobacillus antri]
MKKIWSLLVSVMMLALFTGQALAGSSQAMVRIVHASPDAPAVDVVVDGKTAVQGAKFKDATDYLKLAPGSHKVEIYAAGTVAQGKPVISQNLSVEAGKSYTVAAINKLADLELLVINDETMTTPGKAKVRVGHLSPDAPAVDVAVKDGAVLFPNASFKAVTDFKEVDPATLDLEVRAAGTNNAVLSLPSTTLKANTLYTVLAVGLLNGTPALDVIVLTNTAAPNMPKTGLGGMDTMKNVAAIAAAGAVFFLFRKAKKTSK